MKVWNRLRKMMVVLAVVFCLGGTVTPAMTVYVDTPAVQETQAVQTTGEQGAGDDSTVLMILGEGLSLTILFTVITAVSMVSTVVTVAADMDVGGD